LNDVVEVALLGRALDRGSRAEWDGKSCRQVACHGQGLVDSPAVVPTWNDSSGAARACGACHGIPPTQHTASTSCDRSICHGDEVERSAGTLSISMSGKAIHVNGAIDVQQPSK
jgi:predicted CxxxxCH...CXXCH cytochrome family protein